jgi:hypothetical protein
MVFVRADRDKAEHRHLAVVLAVHFGAGDIEAVAGPAQDTLDDTPFLF